MFLFIDILFVLVNLVCILEWEITLLESLNKRCLFLEHAVNLLGLSNVQILCDRAEVIVIP